jgi:hypothetical protein
MGGTRSSIDLIIICNSINDDVQEVLFIPSLIKDKVEETMIDIIRHDQRHKFPSSMIFQTTTAKNIKHLFL